MAWPRPTTTPTGILTHLAVLPQYTNVTDRQQSDRIGRTVLQTSRKKNNKPKCSCKRNSPVTVVNRFYLAVHALLRSDGRGLQVRWQVHITSNFFGILHINNYWNRLLFGRPFVKRCTVCYRTVICLSVCLSVTLVYCG